MRADPFASPKRRLARAKEHISDLDSRCEAFFDAEPYARVVERNVRGLEEHKVKLTVDLSDPITDIAYEAIEALRSSLDQTAHAVAVVCKAKRLELVYFPVADTSANFENVLKGCTKISRRIS